MKRFDEAYLGTFIEESLSDLSVFDDVKIVKTTVEVVTDKHQTPWVDKWTLHMVEIEAGKVSKIAKRVNEGLDPEHSWYVDFKNEKLHYIIFRGKIFKVDRKYKSQYNQVMQYGLKLGIPDYQLDFSAYIK